MSLAKIISIPGMGGLFKMVAQMRNGGFIVESLNDQKRFPVSSTQRIVMLEDISVYTMESDMPLKDVLLRMKEQDELCSKISPASSPDELKSALKKVIPEFDEERVHASDIKKMFSWYALLKDIIEEEPEAKEDAKETVEAAAPSEEKAETEKPKKPRAAKAKAEAKETDEAPPTEKKPRAPKKTKKES